MNAIVIGTKHTRPTARALARELDADYIEMFVESWNQKTYRLIVRYGNSTAARPKAAMNLVEINKRKSVERVADKPACRQFLMSAGVVCPPTIFTAAEYSLFGDRYPSPYIARPRYHFGGRDFRVISSEEDAISLLKKGYYLQQLIQKSDEYRMLMFRGLIMEASIKVQSRPDADMLIRNHRRGWRFNRVPVAEMPRVMKDACKDCCRHIDIDFCAIDCCFDQSGVPYILEINSAPGLIERKVVALATKIEDAFSSQVGLPLSFPHEAQAGGME